MTITRTTIAGIHGAPQSLAGLEPSHGGRRRVQDAALAFVTLGILLLVAF